MVNRIVLDAGDLVTVSVDTSAYGSGLNSCLRVFQDEGNGKVRQIASTDDFQAHDAGLTFQAPAGGACYIGVSGFDNPAYDPSIPDSGTGSVTGLFDLNLSKTTSPRHPP
jgi:hypothetical protein